MPGVWDISCSLVGQIIWRDNAVLTAIKALYFIRKYFISYAHFYTKSNRQCSIVVVIVLYYYYVVVVVVVIVAVIIFIIIIIIIVIAVSA